MVIEIDVDHRGEGIIAAHSLTLSAGDLPKPVCLLRIAGRSDLHLLAEGRALRHDAVAARLQVGCQKHRDLRMILQIGIGAEQFLRTAGTEHDAARPAVQQLILQIAFVRGIADREKQLLQLLLRGHGSLRFLHPRNVAVAQEKGIAFQIDHGVASSFMLSG